MAKARYLVGTGSTQKLKRNVPQHLKALAGRTAWIERVANLDARAVKERAHLFAVRTDAELRKLKAQAATGAMPVHGSSAILDLDTARAQQIAFAYFEKRHQGNIETGAYFLSDERADYDDLIIEAFEDYRDCVREASGDRRTTDPRALDLLVEHGVLSRSKADDLNAAGWPEELKEHRIFQHFCRSIERADLELARIRYTSWETGSAPIIAYNEFGRETGTKSGSANASTGSSSQTIADLKAAFCKQRGATVTRSRSAQYRIPFRVLEEQLGTNMELTAITREDARKIADFLPRIPSHATQHHKGYSLADAAARHEKRTGAPAGRFGEAHKHLQVIKLAFSHAVNERWIADSPWKGLTIPIPREQRKKHLSKAATYEPFSTDDLNRFFALPLFTGCENDENGCHTAGPSIIKRHRYWAPIIALWTGMRMNEILQLEKADFQTIDSIVVVSVTDEEHGSYERDQFSKRVKSQNAIRDIPLHPIFQKSGFLKWLDSAPDGRLFPEATKGAAEKPSDLYSKRFRSDLKAAGIWKSRRLVFHSFRNSFNDALRDADVPKEVRMAINGWSDQRSMDRQYGRGIKIGKLSEYITKVTYSGLVPPW